MFGVLCRLIWLSSLAYDAISSLTLEFSTPRHVSPDGVAFCFSRNVSLISVPSLSNRQQGSLNWREVLGQSSSWRSSAFFKSSAGLFTPLEPVKAQDLLDRDPFYASSFAVVKYDDVTQDQDGAQLPGGVMGHARDGTVTAAVQTAWTASPEGNCFILTGDWQANTAYLLTLDIIIPSPPSLSILQETNMPPEVWLLPVTYKHVPPTRQQTEPAVQLVVRGSKYGQLCQLRPKAAAALPSMFSACDAAQQQGVAAAGATTLECLSALRSTLESNHSAWSSLFPLNVPPVVSSSSLNASLNPDVVCPAGSVLSPSYGGECISCANGTASAGACTCLPGYTTNLVGPKACGPPLSSDWNVSDGAALSQQLCDHYSNHLQLMMGGKLSDRLVHSLYLAAFTRQAAYLLDHAAAETARESFWQSYVPDERMPASPTRRGRGIGADCQACRHGLFKDIYSKDWVPVQDDRFLAVQTFRLLGYLLDSVGHPCPTLWDPADPVKWMYGRYDNTMCNS